MKKVYALSALAVGGLLTCMADAVQADAFIRGRSGECFKTYWSPSTDLCDQPANVQPLFAAVPAVRTVLREDTRTVHFGFDDATLTPAAMSKLDRLADKLKGAQDIRRAEIIGHADKMGEEGHNMGLSAQRARSVENYLNSRGYWNTSVTLVRGVGSSAAAMSCAKEASEAEMIQCNSPDRKAVISVVYEKEQRDPTF